MKKADEDGVERVDVFGWKGRGDLDLFDSVRDGVRGYRVVEHRKSKESGKVYEDETFVPKENVDYLWGLIRNDCDVLENYDYKFLVFRLVRAGKIRLSDVAVSYDLVRDFIESRGSVEVKSAFNALMFRLLVEGFNGGKFRKEVYFPLLYYPLKVLEANGFVQYFGRGGFMRISDDLVVR